MLTVDYCSSITFFIYYKILTKAIFLIQLLEPPSSGSPTPHPFLGCSLVLICPPLMSSLPVFTAEPPSPA